jgi:hypothetical protein
MKLSDRQKEKLEMGCFIFVAAALIISFIAYVFWGFLSHLN